MLLSELAPLVGAQQGVLYQMESEESRELVLLSAFGTFWVGEGLVIPWPGGDWAIPVLIVGFLLTAALTLGLCRNRLNRSLPIVVAVENA
jgi:hypothetical protein